MSIFRLIIAAGVLLAACSPQDRSATRAELVETRMFAMGTQVDVVLETRGRAADDAALTAVEGMLRTFERDYYAWTEGELKRVNDAIGRGEPITTTVEMAELLATARTLAEKSDWRFDPGVGGLVELWGFHSSLAAPATPSAAALAAWLVERPSIARVAIAGRTVSASSKRVKLDLGGIAKGAIVDRIVRELRQRGYTSVLVNAGGDLRALGARGDRAWRIGIQAPRAPAVLGALSLADGEAVFTSGDYERFFDDADGREHHLLDPATGYPARHTQAVTVIAGEGALADAAATAIFVAGPEHWRAVAAALGIEAVLRVDASGAVESTDAMRTRVELGTAHDPDRSAEGS